jgi:hypothetical protein
VARAAPGGEEKIEPGNFVRAPRDDDVVSPSEIEEASDSPVSCSSTRGRRALSRRVEPIDPVAGHIPGAVNMPYTDSRPGRAGAEVARTAAPASRRRDRPRPRARASKAKLYPGSWSEWSSADLQSSVADFTVRPARPEDTEAAFELFAGLAEAVTERSRSAGDVREPCSRSGRGLRRRDEDEVVGHRTSDGGWIDLGVSLR